MPLEESHTVSASLSTPARGANAWGDADRSRDAVAPSLPGTSAAARFARGPRGDDRVAVTAARHMPMKRAAPGASTRTARPADVSQRDSHVPARGLAAGLASSSCKLATHALLPGAALESLSRSRSVRAESREGLRANGRFTTSRSFESGAARRRGRGSEAATRTSDRQLQRPDAVGVLAPMARRARWQRLVDQPLLSLAFFSALIALTFLV